MLNYLQQEEQAAADLIKEFEASFSEANKNVKSFVKGSVINPGTKGLWSIII